MFCSIIIPFNKIEKYFDKCLKSLANQSIDKKLYEVILINDNCNFKSSNLLNKFLNKNKNFILIYNKQKTIGPGYARNIGIKEAKGKYIYFLDSDDYLTKNTLLNLYNLTLKKKPDLICNDFQVIDKVGNLKKRKRFDLKLLTNTKQKIFSFSYSFLYFNGCNGLCIYEFISLLFINNITYNCWFSISNTLWNTCKCNYDWRKYQ